MKSNIAVVLTLLVAAVACDRVKKDEQPSETQTTGARMTPLDQGNDKSDLEVTAGIRQSIVKNDKLSLDAKNVRIITKDGVVTLRGAVKNDEERATIEVCASSTPGVIRVDDQLTLESPPAL